MSEPRHELKHAISPLDALSLKRRFSAILRPDPHGPDGVYAVRSLYFDDPYGRAAEEKLAGVRDRVKYRLRLYGGDLGAVRLERKAKEGEWVRKDSLWISPEEARELAAGDPRFLSRREEPEARRMLSEILSGPLQPSVLVEYTRTAYEYDIGNCRLTLDEDLRFGFHTEDFFSTCPVLLSAGTLSILEIKFDSYLPSHIAHLAQLHDRGRAAASKFLSGAMRTPHAAGLLSAT